MSELHVFHNGDDWFVAESLDDAMKLYAEHNDIALDDPNVELRRPWLLPDDTVIGVICNEDGEPDDHGTGVDKTAAEWAKQEGRGYLCGRDY